MADVPRGRGTGLRPDNRFDRFHSRRGAEYVDPEPVADEGERAADIPTQVIEDTSRSIIATNDSPDVGFEQSVNPYRGCAHGCAWCYARPFHEYLGFDAGLDFETKILVKRDAPALLEAALRRKSYVVKPLAFSGVTDAYQPLERELEITRGCLEVLHRFRHPVGIVTKSHLVTRDIDLLAPLATHSAAMVALSITTLDASLQRDMEPRTASPRMRLDAVRQLSEAGIPVAVMVAPVIPGLTDHEVPAILEAAREAGATRAAWVMLRLPGAVRQVFVDWLERKRPLNKARVLERLRTMRGGRLNDPRRGVRMRGEGPYAAHVARLFETSVRRLGYETDARPLSTAAFQVPGSQLPLFDTG